MKKSIIILFMLINSIRLYSQTIDHNVYYYIKSPENSIFIYFNDSLLVKDIKYGEHMTLKSGIYKGIVWSEFCKIDTIKFEITTDSILKLRHSLEFTDNYKEYLAKKKEYKNVKLFRSVPLVASIVSSSFLVYSYVGVNKSYSKLEEFRVQYETATPSETSSIKSNYEIQFEKYNAYKKGVLFSSIATASLATATIFSFVKFKKTNKPNLTREPNPFYNGKIGFNIGVSSFNLVYRL
jgi:hypothetical protein